MLVIEMLHFEFFRCADISICCTFRHAIYPSTSPIKYFFALIRIPQNYQMYFDQLFCFQEISMTESHGQNSALNSKVQKPVRIAC